MKAPTSYIGKAGLIASWLLWTWFLAGMTAWAFRNPMGNLTTGIMHFPSMMTFQRLPQFQEDRP